MGASMAAGKLFGPANSANLYNFSLTAEEILSGAGSTDRTFGYIREFHRTKPINPATGRKNPTVVNLSLGTLNTLTGASFIHFQGADLDAGSGNLISAADLHARAIYASDPNWTSNSDFWVVSNTPNSDMVDAIDEGVIVVTSAGNSNVYIDVPGGDNYDNYIVGDTGYLNKDYFFNGYYPFRDYYHRGDNYVINGGICVGALSSHSNESKASFSSWGPGVDVYAAGEKVAGAADNNEIAFGIPYPGQENNQPNWDTLGFSQGTSYSSPYVAGLVACLAEIYPNLTNDQARTWLHNNAVTGLMLDTGEDITVDVNTRVSIGGLDIDRIVLWKNHKKVVGYTANNTYGINGRPASGAVYPRVKKRLRG